MRSEGRPNLPLGRVIEPAVWDGARHFEDRVFWDSPAAPTAERRSPSRVDELSELLARDQLIPVVRGTTYEEVRKVSPGRSVATERSAATHTRAGPMDSTPRCLTHGDGAAPRRPPGPFLLMPDRPAVVASSMAWADQRMRTVASSRERPATSVSHDNASIPVALRMAMASRCTSERGS